MARRAAKVEQVKPTPRTKADAARDAITDVLFAAACALALISPRALGEFDLTAYAAPLYFLQLPLSLVVMLSAVMRLEDKQMPRSVKAGFMLLPWLATAFFAVILLGRAAVWALSALSLSTAWKLVSGHIDRSAVVPGAYMVFERGEDSRGRTSYNVSLENTAGKANPGVGEARYKYKRWRVPMGYEQVTAGTTVVAWVLIAFVVWAAAAAQGGLTHDPDLVTGWDAQKMSQIVSAPVALAAGLVLFVVRAAMQFHGTGASDVADAEVPRIQDDPMLREIVAKVDADARAKAQAEAAAKPPRKKKKPRN